MANLFAIALAENKQVFQPGETISGVLLLNTDKELTLRGVRVELHGLGHVRIRSGKVTYERKETYLGLQAILLGRGENSDFLDICVLHVRFENQVDVKFNIIHVHVHQVNQNNNKHDWLGEDVKPVWWGEG